MGAIKRASETNFFKKIFFAVIFLLALILIGTLFVEKGVLSSALFKSASIITHTSLDETQNNKYTLLILGLLGDVTRFYIVYIILEFVLEGKLGNIFSEVKILKKVKKLRNHFIIAGGGRVGMHVAEELAKNNKKFIIVEKDKELADKLNKKGYLCLNADILEEHEMDSIGIKDAKHLIACLGEDAHNILLILAAKEKNPNLKISARANSEKVVDKLRHAGAAYVVLPEVLGGVQLAENALKTEDFP